MYLGLGIGLIKHLCITQLKLLNHGLVKEAVDAEQVVTEAVALEESGKKLKAQKGDDEIAIHKFSTYLTKIMEGE